MESHVYKVCFNRGKARVWIEGNRLASNGIARGAVYVKRFVKSDSDTTLFLDFAPDADGRKVRVAGTDARPIIDICSAEITDFLSGAESYRATFNADANGNPLIMIERA